MLKAVNYPSLSKALRFSVTGIAVICLLDGPPKPASAQNTGEVDPTQTRDWAPPAIDRAQQMRVFKDTGQGSQPTPSVIPKLEVDDATGQVATFQPGVATLTANNAFFQNLGINGRTCFTCHQPQNGWTISAASVQARFEASSGNDPLFRLVDGATCPTDNCLRQTQARRLRRSPLPHSDAALSPEEDSTWTDQPFCSTATARAANLACGVGITPARAGTGR